MNKSTNSNTVYVPVEELKTGMITADDVLNKFGNILLPKGLKVKDAPKLVQLLQQHNIRAIKIKKEQKPKDNLAQEVVVEDDASIRQKREIDNFKKNFDLVQEDIKSEFENIIKGKAIKRRDLEEKVNQALTAFGGNVNVFQLMEKIKDLDDTTYVHSHNVTLTSYAIGKWLDLSESELRDLTVSSMLADIGKIKVPAELLNKKEKLTEDELDECRKHVIYSHDLIKPYTFLNNKIKQAVLLHHEKMDGSGYPLGLEAEKIPLLPRIIAISDIYNALTSKRPYRDKKSPFEAIRILETEYIDKLDTNILYIFLNRIGNCYIGQEVTLSDGRIGKIVFVPKQNLYKPVIQLKDSDQVIDLGSSRNENLKIEAFI